jgi:glycerol-3-phosphate cytidylyltransferase-like family protein
MPKNKKIIVAMGGGFDPTHIGHVRMFEEAKKLGDELESCNKIRRLVT